MIMTTIVRIVVKMRADGKDGTASLHYGVEDVRGGWYQVGALDERNGFNAVARLQRALYDT